MPQKPKVLLPSMAITTLTKWHGFNVHIKEERIYYQIKNKFNPQEYEISRKKGLELDTIMPKNQNDFYQNCKSHPELSEDTGVLLRNHSN